MSPDLPLLSLIPRIHCVILDIALLPKLFGMLLIQNNIIGQKLSASHFVVSLPFYQLMGLVILYNIQPVLIYKPRQNRS